MKITAAVLDKIGQSGPYAQSKPLRLAALDVDALYVKHAVINEGPKLKRFMPAAQGRATPIQKRTSHVEIVVAEREGR